MRFAPAATLAPTLLLTVLAPALAGCGQVSAGAAEAPTTSPSAPVLAPADRARPSSGFCGTMPGPVALVEVDPGAPAPRCLVVRPDQRLEVVNSTDREGNRGGPLTVRFANWPRRVVPLHAGSTFDRPFGQYLAPGVHEVRLSPYQGGPAEIWLRR